jgi:hypothetical protein
MIPDKSRESYDVRTRCKKNGCQPHAVLASSASLLSRNYLLSTIKDIHFWVSIKSRNEAIPLVNFPTPAQQHNYIARRWVMRLLLNVSLQYEFDNTKEAKASPCRCGLIKNILLSPRSLRLPFGLDHRNQFLSVPQVPRFTLHATNNYILDSPHPQLAYITILRE